jgi:CRP-like cAMP-binding protein
VKPVDVSAVSPADLELFRRVGGGIAYGPGEAIFEAGDPADELYVLGEGQVELSREGTVVEVVGAGTAFGEMGLIDQAPRALDARAVGRVVVTPISADRFTWLVERQPEFALSLLRLLTHRLRRQTGT